ncbi:MAG: Ger(x)C family spore germination protein [Bacilli bacterium]
MKKIFLFLACLILCGCYDYKELKDIALITGVGVDYKDGEYSITLEILTPTPKEAGDTEKTRLVSNSGKTFSDAFKHTYKELGKVPNFSQLQMIFISESTAKDIGLQEIFDDLFRSSRVNNNFYLAIANDCTSYEILNNKQKNDTTSNYILNLLKSNNESSFIQSNNQFDFLIGKIESKGKDIYIPSISLDEDHFKVNDIAIFSDYKMVSYIDSDYSAILSLLTNKIKNTIYYSDGINSIDIKTNKFKYDVKDDKVTITLDLDATIKSIDKEYSLRDKDTFKELEDIFSKKMKKQTENMIDELLFLNSDVLSIGNMYYKKNPKKYYDDYFKDVIYEVNINLNINRFGILFEVIK